MASWHAQLTFAIEHKRLVQFMYIGDSGVAEPREYGKLRGVTTVLVYQIGSGPSVVSGWRLLEVSSLQDLVVLEKTFCGTRQQAGRADGCAWETLFARAD